MGFRSPMGEWVAAWRKRGLGKEAYKPTVLACLIIDSLVHSRGAHTEEYWVFIPAVWFWFWKMFVICSNTSVVELTNRCCEKRLIRRSPCTVVGWDDCFGGCRLTHHAFPNNHEASASHYVAGNEMIQAPVCFRWPGIEMMRFWKSYYLRHRLSSGWDISRQQGDSTVLGIDRVSPLGKQSNPKDN